jgi:hypothetical protein
MKTSLVDALKKRFDTIDSDVVEFIWTDCQCDFEKACKQLQLLIDDNIDENALKKEEDDDQQNENVVSLSAESKNIDSIDENNEMIVNLNIDNDNNNDNEIEDNDDDNELDELLAESNSTRSTTKSDLANALQYIDEDNSNNNIIFVIFLIFVLCFFCCC